MLASFRKQDKKDEESATSGNPYKNLEKASVLQEARTFNDSPVNPRKCTQILTKILYMINQQETGEQLGQTEATETFFAMTKLFQSKDMMLRRMVYLSIKDMASVANDVIIVTSSLTKDMTGKEDSHRGPAIRALCKITDASLMQSVERYMKQAIVDKLPSVSSAALTSSTHLMRQGPEVVKRWVNEVQEAVNHDNIMVQYHALGLLYQIRRADKHAIRKLILKFSKAGLRSPYAYCFLIRIASNLLNEEGEGTDSPMYEFIDSCLRHKNEMVIYEAASTIVSLKCVTPKELCSAVNVLQLFISSPKPVLRYAAVRTLNKVAIQYPAAVTACNVDLETLITDSNRSIATLAITTLLKTGNEAGVDRLMKQISSFMSEISDQFKTVVVDAIKSLCQKFPRKHSTLMSFLANMLREEGGYDYKKAIVNTIITIVEENPEAKEAGLAHLCEFIEDCEHTSLATRILHLLGREGPRTTTPAKYIRYIYNRVILENAPVRAAAVSALAKFGAASDDLLPNVLVLLHRTMLDQDDEVRDRATFFYHLLQQNDKALNSAYILNSMNVSLSSLERLLQRYTMEPTQKPFDVRQVPVETVHVEPARVDIGISRPTEQVPSRQDTYTEQLSSIPEFAHLGPIFKTSPPVDLTESEVEYVVRCIKHVFSHYIVFQFDINNTLNDQLLERVSVQMESADGFEIVHYTPCQVIKCNDMGTTYTLVKLPDDPTGVTGTLTCTMKYTVKDCDPATGVPDDEEGYADEFVLEDVEVTVCDHMQKVLKPNWNASWEEIGSENELEDTYALSMPTLEDAVKKIIQYMGMQPCERSDKIVEGRSSHTLYLAGVYRGGHDILVRAKMALSENIAMQLTVRSTDQSAVQVVASAVD
ncbi:unnamed protein product [Didymodactylos carnosus]|uniref:Coatomer subunit gamma n=1 Tax=Didymodactylos carnosus TaxID=1234261 RepID=A0A8S2HTJ2_9BILA|nr:unnamed protein product [Didymodactylos carnosus]CAF3679783.1 unnamed protein product [Didymodactylos carnosus]